MIINPTKKFKTIVVSVRFKEEIKKENVVLRSLLPTMMVSQTKSYNSKKKVNEAIENIYGASISSRTYKIGKISILDFSLSILHPSFMEEGFFLSGLKLLDEIIFKHKVLPKKYFEQEKRLLIERIIASKNNKTGTALNNLVQIMFKNEKYAINTISEVEDVNNLTYEELNNYYFELINNNDYDVIISGDVNEEIKELVSSYFTPKNINNHYAVDEEVHQTGTVKTIKETDDINQVKLNIGYNFDIRYNSELYYEANLFNTIFGSSTNSRLFQIVREKHSLCYYINSGFDPYKGFLYVYAGIDKNKLDLALNLIDDELNDLKTNLVTDLELELAKKVIISNIKEARDSQGSHINILHQMRLLDRTENPERAINEVNKVTKEGILEVAKKVIIDTIYTLEPEEKNDKETL